MNDELHKRISILERKLERQHHARKEAEQQLEEFSRKIYYSNQALKKSVNEAQKRQTELEYLASATTSVSSEASVAELIASSLELTSQFSNARLSACLFVRNGLVSDSPAPIVFSQTPSARTLNALPDSLLQYVPLECQQVMDNWVIQEVNNEPDIHWAVCINIRLGPEQFAWLAFFIDSDFIDEESLFVLDTAKNQLRTGVSRRLDSLNTTLNKTRFDEAVENLDITRRQLVQAERMATLGQLAAGIAHEINNPVGFIKSNQESLQEYIQDLATFVERLNKLSADFKEQDKQVYDALCSELDVEFLIQDCEEILLDNREGVSRISEIVSNLKTYSHVAQQELKQVDINDCISKAVKIAWNSIKYEHKLILNLDEQLPCVLANAGELQQVFVNLIVNAGQAMQSSGRIEITTSFDNEHVYIAIKDEGIGMDTSVLKQLFTPFFTSKPVGEGTGLGLSVSKAIIDSHNGDIRVESEKGQGTTMIVVLPIT